MHSQLALLALLARSSAFYLPGMAPKDYNKGDELSVQVNRLSSVSYEMDGETLSRFVSVDYYDPDLHFCVPTGGPEAVSGSLGSVLFGDRIYNSPYRFKVLEDAECVPLCSVEYTNEEIANLVQMISLGYGNYWSVDGLPVAGTELIDEGELTETEEQVVVLSDYIPMGEILFPQAGQPQEGNHVRIHYYNHFDFTLEYHTLKTGEVRIVGASVKPTSRNNNKGQCDSKEEIAFEVVTAGKAPSYIQYSYSVKWQESNTPWATRWDKYLHVYEPSINWFALINSSVVVFFLALLTSLILTRMFRKDIANYNEVDLSDDISEEMGWKLVHGDVFRPPTNVMVYSIFAGSGAQLGFSVFATTIIAMFGLISPANRGWFSTSLLMFACLGGAIGGYVSAACYKIWGGTAWKSNLILTPIYVPLHVFGLFMLVNLFMIMNHASGAVPFGNIVAIIALWTLITIPLSMILGFIAFKRNWGEPPVRVNQIPRQVPPQPWYLHIIVVTLVSGFLGFLSISVQMYYIFSAIWFQKLYYMFGFLFTSLFCMVLIAAVFNALVLYLTLRAENYHWQWRSFWVSGGTAIYLYIYAIVYMVKYMRLSTTSGKLMYALYCLIGCGLCYLALGCVGICTSYFLVRKIYSRIKMD